MHGCRQRKGYTKLAVSSALCLCGHGSRCRAVIRIASLCLACHALKACRPEAARGGWLSFVHEVADAKHWQVQTAGSPSRCAAIKSLSSDLKLSRITRPFCSYSSVMSKLRECRREGTSSLPANRTCAKSLRVTFRAFQHFESCASRESHTSSKKSNHRCVKDIRGQDATSNVAESLTSRAPRGTSQEPAAEDLESAHGGVSGLCDFRVTAFLGMPVIHEGLNPAKPLRPKRVQAVVTQQKAMSHELPSCSASRRRAANHARGTAYASFE